MKRWLQFLLFTLAIAALCVMSCAGATLRAGVAKVDITPPTDLPMYGFMERTSPSTGTLDPLYARVLVLEAGEKRLALVTLDLGRVFGPAAMEHLREAVRKQSGISLLVVTASHTHSGPDIVDEESFDLVPAWEKDQLDKIATAVGEACRRLVEARIGAGTGSVYIGYNRRRVSAEGKVTMLWSNPAKIPTSPLDPTVSVLRIDALDGTPIAILVNYACHPVVFGADNLRYSADFVGVMADTVEEAFGNHPICFFLQGASGDINPYFATIPFGQDAIADRDWTGQQLGQEAARAAKGIHTVADAGASLDFADDPLNFRVRWPVKQFRSQLLAAFGPRVFADHADPIGEASPRESYALHVTTILINKTIAFVGMPGEPFVDFQINWRARCPVPHAFFLGYTNGYFDYFPTLRAASEGGYGAGDSDTWIEVGAGERMLDHALVRVYQMLGRLHELPEDLQAP